MDLLIFTETLKTYWIIAALAIAITFTGNSWINYLYIKAHRRNSLSFPEQTSERAKFRKLFLSPILLACLIRAWNQISCPALPYIILAISFLLFMTVTDFEQQVILDEMVFIFALLGLAYTLHLQLSLSDHILAALGGGLFFLLLAVICKGALGGGDIKLVAALGLWLGIKPLASVIIYGAIAGGIAALLLLLCKRIKRTQYIAYGPYFALSAAGILLKWLRVLF